MTTEARSRKDRLPLWRDRVLRAALAHVDTAGLDGFTMRSLAQVLDVAPMALYRHVENKDDLLDGMIDLVFAEIELPPADLDWKAWMRARAVAARAVLARHPWAIGFMESRRRPGPASLRHHDAVIGCLRRSGFSIVATAHAYSLVDAYLYGFALTRANMPSDPGLETSELAAIMAARMPVDDFPYLAEFTIQHVMRPGYDTGEEFEHGLDLVLDALEGARRAGDA